MAYVTGVVLVVLVFIGIPLQVAGYPAVANDVGVVHGILYIVARVGAWIRPRGLGVGVNPPLTALLAATAPIRTSIGERGAPRAFLTPPRGKGPGGSSPTA